MQAAVQRVLDGGSRVMLLERFLDWLRGLKDKMTGPEEKREIGALQGAVIAELDTAERVAVGGVRNGSQGPVDLDVEACCAAELALRLRARPPTHIVTEDRSRDSIIARTTT